MQAAHIRIPVSTTPDVQHMNALVVSDPDAGPQAAVLLYLHGKSSASRLSNDLPLVCRHFAPPFQAILGNLRGTTVIAPQAPHAPDEPWSWSTYVKSLSSFLRTQFAGKRIMGTGFSRGGLGLLQLMHADSELLQAWAIVDPQRAKEEDEAALLAMSDTLRRGWLRYGGLADSKPFAERLSRHLATGNSQEVREIGHGDLAMAAYAGDTLGGSEDLYTFLGLDFRRTEA